MNVLISACLLGEPVRYDGNSNNHKVDHLQPLIHQWRQQERLIPICPEVAGGLGIPRAAAEICGGDGNDVLMGRASVVDNTGRNVSAEFIAGAQHALGIAQQYGAGVALLAARSPSCGSRQIYDGTFQGTLLPGIGVTAALLEQHGIRCFGPDDIGELLEWMREE